MSRLSLITRPLALRLNVESRCVIAHNYSGSEAFRKSTPIRLVPGTLKSLTAILLYK